MTTILTRQEIIEKEFTQKRTDKALIKEESILAAQYNALRPVLGEDFYEDLIASILDNSLTTAESTLINDYIKPFLLPYTYGFILPEVVYHTGGQGIMMNQPDFASNGGRGGLQLVRETANTRADIMKKALIEYLCDNTATFTLWSDCSGTSSQYGGMILYD